MPEDPFSNISFRFGERRSARWSDVRVWQKSGSKREKIKVTKTSKPGCKSFFSNSQNNEKLGSIALSIFVDILIELTNTTQNKTK